jgi:hypothetical protein
MFTTTPVFDGIKGKIKYEVLVFHLELRAGVNLIHIRPLKTGDSRISYHFTSI